MNKRIIILFLSIFTAALLPAATGLQAQTTWYVDDDAPNDPGPGDPGKSDPLEDGTTDHPFDEIQEGVNAGSTGDAVFVFSGVYPGGISISAGIHLAGENRETTFIDASGFSTGVGIQNFVDNIEISGFTIHPPTYNAIDVGSTTLGMVIHNNKLLNGYRGILCWQYTNDITIVENIIAGNMTEIEISAATVTAHHNNFLDNENQARAVNTHFWDNGNEGNYWDNYTGIDTDGDGIGETVYDVPGEGGSQDRYPFVFALNMVIAKAGGPYRSALWREIRFDASGSYIYYRPTDTEPGMLSYRWDWDTDGDWDTDWLSSPVVYYAYPGVFHGEATVEVRDKHGWTAVDTAAVDVSLGANRWLEERGALK